MKLLNKIGTTLKNQDLFSHQVSMHFGTFLDKNSEGDSDYKTIIGGFVSIFIKIFMCYYVYFFVN
jgi:hypothetical protein